MKATLYGIPASHPAFAAELILQRKGIEYKRIDLPQWFHRAILRGLRFPGKTVPALVLDGRRIQTTKAIARALDALRPDPPLVPTDPDQRARVEAAETWADDTLQQVARRLVWWALRQDRKAVDSYLEGAHLLIPVALAKPAAPLIIRILARDNGSTDDASRADLAALPAMLDQVDGWIADGLIGGAEPNVADYQIATTVALLMTLDDLRPAIEARPAGKLAQRLAAGYPGRMPPAFPPDWITVTA
jgi:glutathione S-transferase